MSLSYFPTSRTFFLQSSVQVSRTGDYPSTTLSFPVSPRHLGPFLSRSKPRTIRRRWWVITPRPGGWSRCTPLDCLTRTRKPLFGKVNGSGSVDQWASVRGGLRCTRGSEGEVNGRCDADPVTKGQGVEGGTVDGDKRVSSTPLPRRR